MFKPSERPKFKVEVHFSLSRTSKKKIEGNFVRRTESPELWHDELEFGGFHYSKVRNGKRISTLQNFDFVPPPAEQVIGALFTVNFRMTPTDFVKHVHNRKINGVESRCIDYENNFAKTSLEGQTCVQKDTGAVNYMRYETRETFYSDFASFAGKVRPRHYEIVFEGADTIVADVSYSEVSSFDAGTFEPIAGGEVSSFCAASLPPVAKYGPNQVLPPNFPRQIKGKVIVDVKVGSDGRVLNAAIAQPLRDDLDEIALKNAKEWQFEPGRCDGNIVPSFTKLTLTYK